ncbi:MAG TPA: FAD-dependent oxidoreductase [Pseudonocardiaceae bacterium]|nr:FAD-dependent oxidoreductase [Pseudonocardiaceae bacterium]
MTTFLPEPHLLDSVRGRDWPHYPRLRHAPAGRPPTHADVVIVGAGPAGLALASALWHLDVPDVVLLDAQGVPMRRFFARVDGLSQRVLRSPYDHHPGVEGYRDCELLDFARLHWALLSEVERREIRMSQAGHRSVVPVDVFEAFCDHVATVHQVHRRTWPATVDEVCPDPAGVVVRTTDGTSITARFAALCLGEERRPVPADWWHGTPVDHVGYWDQPVPADAASVTVIGAGLTAAHLVTKAIDDGRHVHWVLRAEQERYQCSDVNASFFRAEGRARFDGGVSWDDRLGLMHRERRASVMFEFRPLLRAAEENGRLTVHRGREVTGIAQGDGHVPVAVLLADGTRVRGDHVVLALGTTPSTGTGLLPAGLVGGGDGWPDLDERTLAYRRAPRVFAVGAAAGMVLGPAARNIDGHRVATARVAATIAARLTDDRVFGEESGYA